MSLKQIIESLFKKPIIDRRFILETKKHTVTLEYDGVVTQETIRGDDTYIMRRTYYCPLLEPEQVYDYVVDYWRKYK